MALTGGRLPTVDRILSTAPPPRLFHYTSPEGLIGIAKSKTLWATYVRFLNDAKELHHAVDVAQNLIKNLLEAPVHRNHYSEPERKLLQLRGRQEPIEVRILRPLEMRLDRSRGGAEC